MKNKPILLVDMDQILVDTVPSWIRQYEILSGDKVSTDQLKIYDFGTTVKYPELFHGMIDVPGFFYNLPPIPHAVDYFSQLLGNDRYEVIVLTQPPRRADYAIKEKRDWLQLYFPNIDLTKIIFTHKKHLVRGDLLFDDKPSHLIEWKKYNPEGKTATIEYPYNFGTKVDFSFEKETAWIEFYEVINRIF